MADLPISFRDFSGKLVLAGSRDTMPRNALRRAVGVMPSPEPEVRSRYGSTTRFQVGNVLNITNAPGSSTDYYLYTGALLLKNSTIIDSGYNGNRLTIAKGPPALGLDPYLFLAGGGKLVKIAPDGTLSQWGIDDPPNQLTGHNRAADKVVIDAFDTSAANWSVGAVNCSVADIPNATFPAQDGVGSMQVTPTAIGPWVITSTPSFFLSTLAQYFPLGRPGVISLPTDLISIYVNTGHPEELVWLKIKFDVNDGTFTDYYVATFQLQSQTDNLHAANPQVIINLPANQWTQLAVPKSSFVRIGPNLSFDWTTINKIRIEGGATANTFTLKLDTFTQYGGYPQGAGPAALSGGSILKYLVTFGNSTTGNDSNANSTPFQLNGVAIQPARLANIPVSSDTQVSNRKLWRTSEGGGTFFYVDTIQDNVTTTYTDVTSSINGQPYTITPWIESATYNPRQLIDGGNGFMFRMQALAGSSGITEPQWNIPTTTWAPLATFEVNDIVLPPYFNGVTPDTMPGPNGFKVSQAGTSGAIQPTWTGSTVMDGTVIWQNIGPLLTTDNVLTWQCITINALPSLGTELLFDNTPFPSTIGDAVFFEGSIFATRDSAKGASQNVYISPSDRAESYNNIVKVGSDDDPPQKLIVWNEAIWVLTTRYIYPLTGSPPAMGVADRVLGAEGTRYPFTVVTTPIGVAYRASTGVRLFDNSSNPLLGYAAISPIEEGQPVENVPVFLPTIAEYCRNEIIFSDGVTTLAYNIVDTTWRMPGLGAVALYYHDELDIIHWSTGTGVIDFEVFGLFNDSGAAIPVEWQIPSTLTDATQQAITKRWYVDIDLAGQILTPSLLVDHNTFTMPNITNSFRGVIEIPFQQNGREIGLRFNGNISARVTLYGVWADTRTGR